MPHKHLIIKKSMSAKKTKKIKILKYPTTEKKKIHQTHQKEKKRKLRIKINFYLQTRTQISISSF